MADRGQMSQPTTMMFVMVTLVVGLVAIDMTNQMAAVMADSAAQIQENAVVGTQTGFEGAVGMLSIIPPLVLVGLILIVVNSMIRTTIGRDRFGSSQTSTPEPEPDPIDVARARYIEGETTLAEFESEVYDAVEVNIPVVETDDSGMKQVVVTDE